MLSSGSSAGPAFTWNDWGVPYIWAVYINPYRAGQKFSSLRYVPQSTKVLVPNFIHTVPHATKVTHVTYSCVDCRR